MQEINNLFLNKIKKGHTGSSTQPTWNMDSSYSIVFVEAVTVGSAFAVALTFAAILYLSQEWNEVLSEVFVDIVIVVVFVIDVVVA